MTKVEGCKLLVFLEKNLIEASLVFKPLRYFARANIIFTKESNWRHIKNILVACAAVCFYGSNFAVYLGTISHRGSVFLFFC